MKGGKRTSKYKNIIGEEKSYKFTNINLVSEVSEGSFIACNGSFIACSWNSTPGSVAVLDTPFPINVKINTPILKGHKRSVFDMAFSPFKYNILATASDDATCKLWEIPSGGLRQNLNQDLITYKGHTRRVSLVRFNPVADNVMATASTDYSLHVWNSTKGETYAKADIGDIPTSLDWNTIGSLVGVTTKKKMINIFDPRANKSVLVSQIYESPRSPKFTWVGDNTFVTTGFSKNNVKELKLWDIRKVTPELKSEGPVQKLVIDNLLTVTTPFYDHESKLLFTSAKGELSIHIYDFNDSIIHANNDFKSKTPALSVHMFERKILDYNKCEIDRFIQYNNKKEINFISFCLSRKNPEYEPALYPPVFSGEPALTYDQWVAGENKEPIKKEIHLLGNKNENQTEKGETKVTDGSKKEEVVDNELEQKIKIIEEKVNKKQAIYDKLLKEKEELDKRLKAVKQKKEEVNDKLRDAFRAKALRDKEKEKNQSEKKEEVKEETKEEVKMEIIEQKEEPKVQVKEEVKEESKEEVKEESKEEVKEEPKEEVKMEIIEQKEEPKEQVKEEVKEESKEEVKEELKEEVKMEIIEQKEESKEEVIEESKEEQKLEIKEEPKEEIKMEIVEQKEEPKEEVKEESKEEIIEQKEEPKEEKVELKEETKDEVKEG